MIATPDNTKAGDFLVVGRGFRCLAEGAKALVMEVHDEAGHTSSGLFVPCTTGRHYLDSALVNGEYRGFSHEDT